MCENLIAKHIVGPRASNCHAVDCRVESFAKVSSDPSHPDLVGIAKARAGATRVTQDGDAERRQFGTAKSSGGVNTGEAGEITKARVEHLSGYAEEGPAADHRQGTDQTVHQAAKLVQRGGGECVWH